MSVPSVGTRMRSNMMGLRSGDAGCREGSAPTPRGQYGRLIHTRPVVGRESMAGESFDAIIIGAGQAGPALAARCSREGLRTALIERGELGGTCVNVGCVPTKTMV